MINDKLIDALFEDYAGFPATGTDNFIFDIQKFLWPKSDINYGTEEYLKAEEICYKALPFILQEKEKYNPYAEMIFLAAVLPHFFELHPELKEEFPDSTYKFVCFNDRRIEL